MLEHNRDHRRLHIKENTMKNIIIGALLSGGVAVASLGLSTATANAFNPQPDPPGDSVASPFIDPGVIRGFNPQPDPPGKVRLNPGLIRGFNPQPEPPTG
jgi:hypothetical protein